MAELQAELQRLSGTTLDAQGAANAWAGTTGLDLVGAINAKAGTAGLDLARALNQLAGTAGLEVGAAAAAITSGGDPTMRLTLPGANGNYASTPDSAGNSITGDIDIRVKLSMADWTPTAQMVLVAKAGSTGTRSYSLEWSTAGAMSFNWSTAGTAFITKGSTTTAAFANGEVHWVRAVLDVNNEASGNDVFFYTSEDGETWTQLGNTVTTAGVTSIFDSTSAVEIGSRFGGTVGALAGSVYYVEIRNGIDGTVVNSFDASTVTPAGPRDPATVTAGGPWTINGASWSWASGT